MKDWTEYVSFLRYMDENFKNLSFCQSPLKHFIIELSQRKSYSFCVASFLQYG